MPELTKRKVYDHDVFIKLKVFIDFETVYDTTTVEHSIKTYSISIYPQRGLRTLCRRAPPLFALWANTLIWPEAKHPQGARASGAWAWSYDDRKRSSRVRNPQRG